MYIKCKNVYISIIMIIMNDFIKIFKIIYERILTFMLGFQLKFVKRIRENF